MNSYRISSLMRDQFCSFNQRNKPRIFLWGCITLSCLILFGDSPLSGQEPEASTDAEQSYSIGSPEPDIYQLSKPTETIADRGFGWTGRFGHHAGQAVGREESISNLELMPYLFNSVNGVAYVDGRLYRTNQSGLGGSIGLGYRQYVDAIDRIFGVTFYYDKDDSRKTATFEQRVLSVETLGEYLDARANFYMPTGERTKILETDLLEETVRFSGNFLLYDLRRSFGTAMKGVDGEIGIPIRSELGMKHNMKILGGAYHFQDEDHVLENIWGWKTRLTAELINNLNLNFEVTNDNVFKTSVQFGVVYNFDMNNLSLEQKHKDVKDRMLERVNRLSTTVVVNSDIIDTGLVATNPNTGNPYFFRHVDSNNAAPGLGTFEDPFVLLSQAQADLNYDIIYVHADSVFNGADASVVTQAGKRILGEGQDRNGNFVVHQINEASLGLINLPVNPTLGTNRPIFNNAPGNGVVLNANSEFSGFVIQSPTLNGLISNGVNHSILSTANHLDILDASLDGILLQNLSGNVNLSNNRVANPLLGTAQNAFHVEGGNANINYRDTLVNNGLVDSILNYSNNSGNIVLVNNTTGGSVNLDGTSITENNGNGISITNNAGTVFLDNGTINDSNSTGINVTGNNNRVTFNNSFVINRPAGTGFNAQNNLANGNITIGDLTINDREGIGFNYENNQGTLTSRDNTTVNINGNGLALNNEIALDYVNNSGDLSLFNLSISEGNSQGIRIGDGVTQNSGEFAVRGTTIIDQIQGDSLLIQNNDPGHSTVFGGDLSITNRGGIGINIIDENGDVNISNVGNVNVSNAQNSTAVAINLENNTGSISFGNTTVTNTRVANGIGVVNPFVDEDLNLAGVFVDSNTFVSFNSLSIDATAGDALRVKNNDNFAVDQTTGIISALSGSAIDIFNNDDFNANFAAVSNNGLGIKEYGIRVVDSDGIFINSGTGLAGVNSGGTLTNNTFGAIVLANNNLTDVVGDDQSKYFETNSQLISLNFGGIRALNWTTEDVDAPTASEIVVNDSNINTSLIYGLDAINVDSITLNNNIFSQNGVINFNGDTDGLESVRVLVTRNRAGNVLADTTYDYIFLSNQITDENAEAVTISGTSIDSDDDTPILNVLATNDINLVNGNVFTVTSSTEDAFLINWDGLINTANFNNNRFVANAAGLLSNTGLNIIGNSFDVVSVQNNVVTSNSATGILESTGFNFSLGNGNQLLINNNAIGITGDFSTGVLLDLGNVATFQFNNNIVDMRNQGGIALDVLNIGSSAVSFSGNDLNLFQAVNGATIESGVLFENITSPITINGTVNNTIDDGTGNTNSVENIFLVNPAINASGSILINGQTVTF